MLIKSDVIAVTPDVSLYPSSAYMWPIALMYLPDTWRIYYGQWMWKACRNEQHLLSKSQCSAWKQGLCSLYCSLTTFFSYTWHSYHFGSRFLITAWSQILQLRQTGEEMWAQFCSCPECWVHPVCCWWCWPKLKFSGCPNTFHGMGDIANVFPDTPTLGGILLYTVKMDEL